MTEVMTRMYEGMFLVDAAANWDGVMDAVNKTLSRANAEVISLRKWDERRLAYPIGQCNRGTYILSYFRAEPKAVTGIERDVVLSETLLRAMVLRADRIPQAIIDGETPATRVEREKSEAEAARAEAIAQAEAKAQAEAEADTAESPADDAPVLAPAEPFADSSQDPQEPTPEPTSDLPAGIEQLIEDVSDAQAQGKSEEDQDSDTVTPPPA